MDYPRNRVIARTRDRAVAQQESESLPLTLLLEWLKCVGLISVLFSALDPSAAIGSRGTLCVKLNKLDHPQRQGSLRYFLSREDGSYGLNLKRDSASPRFWMNASEL